MRQEICVIAGGSNGIGFATAKQLGKKYRIIITGRNQSKLESAVEALKNLGIEADFSICDVSQWKN